MTHPLLRISIGVPMLFAIIVTILAQWEERDLAIEATAPPHDDGGESEVAGDV